MQRILALVGQTGAFPSNRASLGASGRDPKYHPRTKKNRESRGFSDAAERTRTSTGLTPTRPSTNEDLNANSVNHGLNRDDAERLHHWLHLIAESGEHSVASVLVDAIAETLGVDAVRSLIEVMESRCKPLSTSQQRR